MIHAYSTGKSCGDVEKAVELFEKMIKDGIKPTLVTYNSMIHANGKEGKMEDAEAWFARMGKYGIKPNLYVFSVFNTMISGYTKFGSLEIAERWFARMVKAGIKPNAFVVDGLMEGGKAPTPGEWYTFLKRSESILKKWETFKDKGMKGS
jgi:pentatricopeptide repeat protein